MGCLRSFAHEAHCNAHMSLLCPLHPRHTHVQVEFASRVMPPSAFNRHRASFSNLDERPLMDGYSWAADQRGQVAAVARGGGGGGGGGNGGDWAADPNFGRGSAGASSQFV